MREGVFDQLEAKIEVVVLRISAADNEFGQLIKQAVRHSTVLMNGSDGEHVTEVAVQSSAFRLHSKQQAKA